MFICRQDIMDPENVGKEAILKVTDWLKGIWEMRRRAGPIQQWVDSIPLPTKPLNDISTIKENPTPPLTPASVKDCLFGNSSMTISMPMSVPSSPAITMTGTASPIPHHRLARDPSFQSDSSHCSSVESLLELRRADPEAILLGLGFGGCPNNSQENGPLSRIPKRFLQPSKLKGIAINDFVKQQQETSESLDSASLGYRGLTGSPYVAPSEIVQKIMERLRDHESHDSQDAYTVHNNNTEPYSPIFQDTSRLSVLSPDNRQFLERPRSKSPDMRNKRMIIGQKSFAFGCDGDLIEIDSRSNEEEEDDEEIREESTNGNNHSIELDDSGLGTEAMLSTSLRSSIIDKSKEATISNIRNDKKLGKQLSIDDSAQDLNSPETLSLPEDEYCDRTNDDYDASSTSEVLRRIDSGENNDRWKLRKQRSEDEQTLLDNPRRASDSLCDTKMPWTRLFAEGRRFSEGVIRQTSLLTRRKSLKRQSRISDAEASHYCEKNSPSETVEPMEIAQFNAETESSDFPETSKLKTYETETSYHRSDSLSDYDIPDKSSTELNENINVDTSVETLKKKTKKRSGLSALRDIHKSVMSIRMEPGF